MSKQKECGVFELMGDVVKEWVKRNKISVSQKEMNDLSARLSKAREVLRQTFSCQQANRLILNEDTRD